MSALHRLARVVAVIAAVVSALAVHFVFLLWVVLGSCSYDSANPDAAACGGTVMTVWYALVTAGVVGMVLAGAAWIAGRDTAPHLAIAWLLTLFVVFVPVVALGA